MRKSEAHVSVSWQWELKLLSITVAPKRDSSFFTSAMGPMWKSDEKAVYPANSSFCSFVASFNGASQFVRPGRSSKPKRMKNQTAFRNYLLQLQAVNTARKLTYRIVAAAKLKLPGAAERNSQPWGTSSSNQPMWPHYLMATWRGAATTHNLPVLRPFVRDSCSLCFVSWCVVRGMAQAAPVRFNRSDTDFIDRYPSGGKKCNLTPQELKEERR